MSRFKSHNQRKAVMAKLKNMNYRQLRPNADADGDGVINRKDCKPLDPKRQGLIHDLIKRKQRIVKAREKSLEETQDLLLRRIDKEKTTLNKHMAVQKKINDNKKLKQELSELKKANFAQTKTGRIIAVTRGTAHNIIKSKSTKRLLKKIFQ